MRRPDDEVTEETPALGRKHLTFLNRKIPLRFLAAHAAMAYSVGVRFMENPPSDAIQMTVLGLIAGFLGVDTIRPSGFAKDK